MQKKRHKNNGLKLIRAKKGTKWAKLDPSKKKGTKSIRAKHKKVYTASAKAQ